MTVISSLGGRKPDAGSCYRSADRVDIKSTAEITSSTSAGRNVKGNAEAVHARKYQLAREQRKNAGNSTFETQRRNRNI